MKPIKPVYRPPLLYITVQDAIREYILDNHLNPGDMLPAENELARQLDVSRNSVREAVRSLESLGVIETRRGSGLYVRDFSFEPLLNNLPYGLLKDLHELSDLLQVRRVLETGLIKDAMVAMPDSQKDNLEAVVERMGVRAKANKTFTQEDREFHTLLFEHLNNTILTRLLDVFWMAFNKASRQIPIWDGDPLATYHAHAAIIAAIRADDPARASIALDAHYAGLEGRLERLKKDRDDENE